MLKNQSFTQQFTLFSANSQFQTLKSALHGRQFKDNEEVKTAM